MKKSELNKIRKEVVGFFEKEEKKEVLYRFNIEDVEDFRNCLDAIILFKKWCVLDLETTNLLVDVEYLVDKLEIGVVGVLGVDGKKYDRKYFFKENLRDLIKELQKYDLVVGYNIYGFDLIILESHLGADISFVRLKSFDLMFALEKQYRRRFKLNDLIRENFGINKKIDGYNIPELFKQGKIEEVLDHLDDDLLFTKRLFELYVNNELKVPLFKN